MIKTEEAGEIVLELINRMQRRLAEEGIKEWDRGGEGKFAEFIRWYIGVTMGEIARWN